MTRQSNNSPSAISSFNLAAPFQLLKTLADRYNKHESESDLTRAYCDAKCSAIVIGAIALTGYATIVSPVIGAIGYCALAYASGNALKAEAQDQASKKLKKAPTAAI